MCKLFFFLIAMYMTLSLQAQEPLFKYRSEEPRWSSPENLNGIKGRGGQENFGGKGHPNDPLPSGDTLTLLDVKGTGEIRRIWITIDNRSPEMLRSLRLEMFWDGEAKPAVSVPFGDFFGLTLGKINAYENALFSTAEGRSFNCFIPMPFRSGARIQIVNESDSLLNLVYFDVDYVRLTSWDPANLYFHACWQRDTATTLARDFELLPRVSGKGRLLGVGVGVNANPQYENIWFGEGEVKVYLDGDTTLPTLVGTGTEDYIGTGWNEKRFINRYTGCTVASDTPRQYAFYRLHIPDPIYFSRDCRATLQQIGGAHAKRAAKYQAAGAPMIPLTYGSDRLYNPGKPPVMIDTRKADDPWVNFYRSDDVCAIVYFYLDRPGGITPPLQPVAIRVFHL
ncbi:glycoside hydrolase family 172 protein [Parafilimonas sp.]|uniref:glycoside hydrolase family 172 protein n=1 Tax=Parafilimonas sp. TaxID=1969739 RepID=UPI0039E50D8D